MVNIDIKENLDRLFEESASLQDNTEITFTCECCHKIVKLKSFYTWKRKSGVFICGKCKNKKTKIDKYGSLENFYKQRQTKIEKHNLEKYGVKNVFQTKDVMEKSKETSLQRYGFEHPQSSDIVKSHQRETFERTLGVANPFVSKECREKAKQTNLKKYGVECTLERGIVRENSRKAYRERKEEIISKREKVCLEKYGNTSPIRLDVCKKKMQKTRDKNHTWDRRKYLFDGEYYDSSWEIMYVLYCRENHINIQRNHDIYFEYICEGTTHRYYPDFVKEGNSFVEVKGTHLLNKDPFSKGSDKMAKAKYQCMLDNKVEVLSGEFFEPIRKTYPQKYFRQFLVNCN